MEVILSKIKSIKKAQPVRVFDIQTRNHTFIANDHVVHNCLIFQEGVMMLAEKVAGFPKDKCDEVRRAIMKRSISGGDAAKAKVDAMQSEFVEGAVKNGYDKKVASDLYEKIAYFSGYAFNRCVAAGTFVNVHQRDRVVKKCIESVENGDMIMTRDEQTKKNVLVPVKRVHRNGIKKIFEVTLVTGEKIKCTMNHKFRTTTGKMLPLNEILKRNLSIVVK